MTPPTNDEQLRSLIQGAVADVEPGDGLDSITARTARRRTHHDPSTRWLPVTAAAVIAVALVIGGTVWISRQTSSTTQAGGPSGPGHRADEGAPVARDLNLPVAYVGATAAGPRLFTEYHEVRHTTDTPLQAAVKEAFTRQPDDPDYRNYLSDFAVTPKATLSGQLITIDLARGMERPAGMSAQAAQMAIQAVVWTADTAASAGRAPVRFTVDKAPVASVLGVDTSAPVGPASADSVMSPVSIDVPVQGADLPPVFEVRGQAATFEANVVWELKQGSRVVRHGFSTASLCCTLSPYSFTVWAPDEPGRYTLVVRDTDESGGEGIGTSEDTKDITLR